MWEKEGASPPFFVRQAGRATLHPALIHIRARNRRISDRIGGAVNQVVRHRGNLNVTGVGVQHEQWGCLAKANLNLVFFLVKSTR